MATKEEHALARRMFKHQCILANAKVFQDLVWAVMKAKHGTAFEPVAPQGSKGDGGNDGYLPGDKHYFQLYAPLDPKEKAGVAAKKLADDFAKLKKQWGGKLGRGLAQFTFAYNDKYEGVPKDIAQTLANLRTKHAGVVVTSYGSADLETDFMNLPETEWDRILGGAVPDPDRIRNLDYSVFGEVVRHILAADIVESDSRFDLPPELAKKIKLNKLMKRNAVLIENGALYTGHVEKYFSANSTFALDELRDHVVGVYEAAKKAVTAVPPTDGTAVVDAVFTVFRHNLFPKSATTRAGCAVDQIRTYGE